MRVFEVRKEVRRRVLADSWSEMHVFEVRKGGWKTGGGRDLRGWKNGQEAMQSECFEVLSMPRMDNQQETLGAPG